MLHDDHLGLNPTGFGLRTDQRFERIGSNQVGCDTALFEFNAVVETPR